MSETLAIDTDLPPGMSAYRAVAGLGDRLPLVFPLLRCRTLRRSFSVSRMVNTQNQCGTLSAATA